MRSRLLTVALIACLAFLIITNPVVGNAASMITGKQIAKNAITTRQIKNGSVTSHDVKNGSLKAKDLSKGVKDRLTGTTGPVGATGATGATGPAGASASALWAVVQTATTADPHGELIRSSHATSVTRIYSGAYEVTFDRSVLGCAYSATAGSTGDTTAPIRFATVEQAAPAAANPNSVFVRLRDADGTQSDPETDSGDPGFSLMVSCP